MKSRFRKLVVDGFDRFFMATCAWALLCGIRGTAGEWPQILGPHRNGHADGEQLPQSWPDGGPPVLWQHKLGAGFAGPAVANNRVIVFHRVGDAERVEALDANNGEQIWQTDFEATYGGGYNSDHGPRCVPLVHDGNVYLFGAAGDLYSVSLDEGKKRWSRDVYGDFDGDDGYFGAGSTPIVAGNKLLVNVGGRSGAGLVAFSLDTGKTAWKKTDERASYSSPTAAKIKGKEHVVFVTRMNAISVDPQSGATLFRFPFGKRGLTVTGASPVFFDDHLFVSASYQIGAQLADVSGRTPKIIWSSDDRMSSQYNTPIHLDGYLYGIHGREDQGMADLRCLEAKSGKTNWTKSGFGVANMILAGDKLLIMRLDGELVLAKANPKSYQPLDSAQISQGINRALPALSNGRLYIRNNPGSGGELKCFVVAK